MGAIEARRLVAAITDFTGTAIKVTVTKVMVITGVAMATGGIEAVATAMTIAAAVAPWEARSSDLASAPSSVV